jgi:hypothetical protein
MLAVELTVNLTLCVAELKKTFSSCKTRFLYDAEIELIVTAELESVPVANEVSEPLEGVDHAGTPPTTAKTCPVVPIPSRVFVLAVAER